MKILATSDLHIGKSSTGVDAGVHEKTTKSTWKKIVDLSVRCKIDLLVLTGDIIDRDDRYYEAIGQLQWGFDELNKSSIDVIMVAGNHDYDVTTEIMTDERYSNVKLLGANGKWELITREKEGTKIQFVGWSFPQSHYSEDPTKVFYGVEIDKRFPAIGLLHCDFGNKESNYGPVELYNLNNKNLNAWILGHIHKHQFLSEDPIIFYPGSPHALSPKEQGIHGAVMLNVSSSGTISAELIPLSPIRYESMKIDISEAKEEDELRRIITSGITDSSKKLIGLHSVSCLVWDICLTGVNSRMREVEAWSSQVIGEDLGLIDGSRIQVRKVISEIQPAVKNIQELARENSPAGRLAESICALENGLTNDFLDDLIKNWLQMANKTGNALTYEPIRRSAPGKLDKNEVDAKEFILKESKRLLSELLSQIEK